MTNKEPPKRYKVGEIAIDEDGVWWFIYVGTHPDQGGPTYRWGAVGLMDPVSLGNAVGGAMTVEQEEYLRKIKEKVVQPPQIG